MQQKMDLIHQIRALESVPVNRQKLVDLTTLAGYGFLGEMSIAEVWLYICTWNVSVFPIKIIKKIKIETAIFT